MPLHTVHGGLSNACLLFSLIIAGYGLLTFIRNQTIAPAFWGALVIGEVLYLAQMVVGILLFAQGGEPSRGWLHYLYGIVIVISLPGLYAFTRGRDTRREALLYAFIGVFLAGIALRASDTALLPSPFGL
jgi:hypothetical protein